MPDGHPPNGCRSRSVCWMVTRLGLPLSLRREDSRARARADFTPRRQSGSEPTKRLDQRRRVPGFLPHEPTGKQVGKVGVELLAGAVHGGAFVGPLSVPDIRRYSHHFRGIENTTQSIRTKPTTIRRRKDAGYAKEVLILRGFLVVPGEGLEPATNGLQNRCSTAELTRRTPFVTVA